MWLDRVRAVAPAASTSRHRGVCPLRVTAKLYGIQQFTQAPAFLAWLYQQHIDLTALTQRNLDTLYATARVHQRHRVHGFLTWAITHGHLS